MTFRELKAFLDDRLPLLDEKITLFDYGQMRFIPLPNLEVCLDGKPLIHFTIDTGDWQNRFCPLCGNKTLRHLETCEPPDPEHCKDTWTCDCTDDFFVYTFTKVPQ